MAAPPHRLRHLLDALGLIAIAATGIWLGLALRPPENAIASDSANAAESSALLAREPRPIGDTSHVEVARLESKPATSAQPSAATTPTRPPAALPPNDQPIARTYTQLAARARAGDAAAARRLAENLNSCNLAQMSAEWRTDRPVSPGTSVEELARIDKVQQRILSTLRRCDGVSRTQMLEGEDWVRQAALSGDAEAMLCSAMDTTHFRTDLLSPDWRRYALRWRDEAPGMAERALFAGLPEAAAVLAAMYSPVPDLQMFASTGLLGDRPDLAYFYARIFRDRSPPALQVAAQKAFDQRAARLDGATRAALDQQAAAFEARIRFTPMPEPTWDWGTCPSLRLISLLLQ